MLRGLREATKVARRAMSTDIGTLSSPHVITEQRRMAEIKVPRSLLVGTSC